VLAVSAFGTRVQPSGTPLPRAGTPRGGGPRPAVHADGAARVLGVMGVLTIAGAGAPARVVRQRLRGAAGSGAWPAATRPSPSPRPRSASWPRPRRSASAAPSRRGPRPGL